MTKDQNMGYCSVNNVLLLYVVCVYVCTCVKKEQMTLLPFRGETSRVYMALNHCMLSKPRNHTTQTKPSDAVIAIRDVKEKRKNPPKKRKGVYVYVYVHVHDKDKRKEQQQKSCKTS